MSETDPIKAAFLAGFGAGFAMTQEGYNGECAFDHLMPDSDEIDVSAIELPTELAPVAETMADAYVLRRRFEGSQT